MDTYNADVDKKVVKSSTEISKTRIPWIEKFRPMNMGEIISHETIIASLQRFIDTKSLPHLLFFGPSGSGKTSTIMCCARAIYNEYTEFMIMKLNASNERGIETVRTKIKNFVASKNNMFIPMKVRNSFKLVILDEIDSMTVEAQNVLRQIIEKNSVTTRFCLICNDIDKINVALQSRCTLYRFSPLKPEFMIIKLKKITKIEKIIATEEAIDAIVLISKGDMRSAINTLQYAALTAGSMNNSERNQPNNDKIITLDLIYKISGYSAPEINKGNFKLLMKLYQKKITLQECVEKLATIISEHNITLFNLLSELKKSVMAHKLTTDQKIFLIDNFAKCETYDSLNIEPRIILMNVASLFVLL